jgi:hypothetical protein
MGMTGGPLRIALPEVTQNHGVTQARALPGKASRAWFFSPFLGVENEARLRFAR